MEVAMIGGLNSLLAHWGKAIISREQLYEWQINPIIGPSYNPTSVPDAAREYLVPDNPRLMDLKRRYTSSDPKVTTPLQWTDDHVRTAHLAHFRGDNAYVFQVRAVVIACMSALPAVGR